MRTTECALVVNLFLNWNLDDCRVLRAAIEKYAKGFLDQWNVNVHRFMSLPGVAQDLGSKNVL